MMLCEQLVWGLANSRPSMSVSFFLYKSRALFPTLPHCTCFWNTSPQILQLLFVPKFVYFLLCSSDIGSDL